ncbi:hypothetical protein B0H14DRAFT_2628944 [Mycena olivaceomarginata]|nr:hypothetical protein B0H14DRAFT_2628944 [Mycena olivaceomarginata]
MYDDKASSPSRRGRCSSRFVRTLIGSFAFLRMSFDAGKQNLWEGDPVGYVRLSVDEYESFGTPVSAATSFLFSLASNRTKTTFMPILGFIIMRHPDVSGNTEQFLLQFCDARVSERGGVCEVLGTVTKEALQWSSDEHLNVNFRTVAAELDDPEFPVRVQAALALTEMVLFQDGRVAASQEDAARVRCVRCAVPESLNYGWPGIVGGVLKFRDIREAITAHMALEELEGDDDGDLAEGEKILDMNEDDQDVWDEDSAYLGMLANEVGRGGFPDERFAHTRRVRVSEKKSEKAKEGGEDSDDDDEISEELLYFSALDTMQNAPVYQAATTSLTLEQQTLLMEVMRAACQRDKPSIPSPSLDHSFSFHHRYSHPPSHYVAVSLAPRVSFRHHDLYITFKLFTETNSADIPGYPPRLIYDVAFPDSTCGMKRLVLIILRLKNQGWRVHAYRSGESTCIVHAPDDTVREGTKTESGFSRISRERVDNCRSHPHQPKHAQTRMHGCRRAREVQDDIKAHVHAVHAVPVRNEAAEDAVCEEHSRIRLVHRFPQLLDVGQDRDVRGDDEDVVIGAVEPGMLGDLGELGGERGECGEGGGEGGMPRWAKARWGYT